MNNCVVFLLSGELALQPQKQVTALITSHRSWDRQYVNLNCPQYQDAQVLALHAPQAPKHEMNSFHFLILCAAELPG